MLLLGAPDAAVRAALLLSLLAASRWGGRPLSAEGALAAAYLGMTALDPGAPGRIGFQLSFAGAAGLARLAPALERWLRGVLPRLPRGVRTALAAGRGPERRSRRCRSRPGTSSASRSWAFPGPWWPGPLVSVAIPGLLLILIVGPVSEGAASFLAGGTDLVLALLIRVVEALATPSWAALFAARGWVLGVGGPAALVLRRARWPRCCSSRSAARSASAGRLRSRCSTSGRETRC